MRTNIGLHVYFGRSDGNLYRVDIADNVAMGLPQLISEPALDGHDWSGRMLTSFAGDPPNLPQEPDSSIEFAAHDSLVADPVILGEAYAPGGLAGVKVALRDRDSTGWLRQDGSIGSFQWLDANVDTPGAEQSSWSIDVTLDESNRWRVVSRADALNGMKEIDRPSVRFEVGRIQAYNLDFATSTSYVGSNWTRVTANTDNSVISWSGDRVTSIDRGTGVGANGLNQDLVFGSGTTTLNLRIGTGVWRAIMYFGDALLAQEGIVVRAESEFIAEVSAGVGEYVYVSRGDAALPRQFDIELQDGELNLEISDVIGERAWSLTRLSLQRIADLPSPVAP